MILLAKPNQFLDVDTGKQVMVLIDHDKQVKSYPVSTAKNGLGEQMGSKCTPTGWHRIRAKIGQNRPLNSVFIGRRPTGEIYTPEFSVQAPERDWILTRILWLGGMEPLKNRYGKVDSTWRYIYIHGYPDELMQGQPASQGCIRMLNSDVLELFDRVDVGIWVFIHG